ncbi:hypothetical protein D3C83_292200 [compost metagenome]
MAPSSEKSETLPRREVKPSRPVRSKYGAAATPSQLLIAAWGVTVDEFVANSLIVTLPNRLLP